MLPRAAALVLLSGLAGGCGAGGAPPSGAVLTVYVSVPLAGEGAEEGRLVAAGADAALAQAGGEAAGVEVRAEVVETAAGDPAAAAGSARRASEDSTAIAYIGELDSEGTRTSLPITNEARMLQLSPAAGAVGLVAPFEGSDEVPPETQPTGARTFGTLAALRSEERALGFEAMALVLDAIARAGDPLDRASVVMAFLATGERDSELGTYSIDDVGRAEPVRRYRSRSRSAGSSSAKRNS